MALKLGGRLARSAALVAAGTAGGQVILLLSSIVIARLFTPAQIGAFVAMSAVGTVLAIFLTGRYELAMPLPSNHEDAVALGRLGLALAVTTGSLVAVSLAAIPDDWWSLAFGTSALFAWAVPLLSLGLAMLQIANQAAVRARLYGALATRALLFPFVAGTLQVLAGVMNIGVAGLVLAVFLGQLVAAIATWLPSVKKLGISPWASGGRSSLTVARTYWTFPAFLAPAGALNAFASQLPVLLVAGLFGMTTGGQFGMATKLLAAPVALLGQTVGYVYAGEIAHRGRHGVGKVAPLFFKTSFALTSIGAVMALVLFLAAEPIFVTLLGERWRAAGTFAVALSIGVCAQLITAPISQTLVVAGFQKSQFALDLLRVVLICGAAAAAHQSERSALETVWWLSIATAAGYAIMWSANMHAVKRMDRLRTADG